jgi:hypothetical protein
VILSKKGFDATYGGFASPILLGERLISLPVPALSGEDKRIKFRELSYGKNKKIVELLAEMGKKRIKIPGCNESKSPRNRKDRWELLENRPVHLDPDVRRESYPRKLGWRGLFGINGMYQSHIENRTDGKGLEPGDLFLFFGWFKEYRYDSSNKLICAENKKDYPEGKHVIFGYLQIGTILQLWKMNKCDPRIQKWMDYHPHIGRNRRIVGSRDRWLKKNTLYVARKTFNFDARAPKKPGSGLFRFDDCSSRHITLTKKGCTRATQWGLPRPFTTPKKAGISHCPKPWGWETWEKGYFQLPPTFGQEFVIEECAEIEKWARSLIRNFAGS